MHAALLLQRHTVSQVPAWNFAWMLLGTAQPNPAQTEYTQNTRSDRCTFRIGIQPLKGVLVHMVPVRTGGSTPW